jgi:alanyl-tRNA synthetase
VCYSNVHDNGQAQPLWQIRVTEMSKPVSGLIVHTGEVLHGIATAGDSVWAMVDDVRRWDIMRNHTATHLLHAELRATLGEHVRQSGSLVAPDRLRFDFAHNTMLTQTELATITTGVNNAILTNYPVKIDFQSRTEAITQGAMALFGEKYGEVVRTVKIGEPTVISFELCGGTHVPQTADIGAFVILSEGAVAAGVRRVEALTGRAAQAYIQKQLQIVNTAAAYLNVKPAELDRKVLAVLEENTNLQKQLAKEKLQTALHKLQELLASTPTQAGKVLLTAQLAVDSADLLRQVAEAFRQQVVSGAAVLTTVVQGKPQIAVVVSADLVAQGCNAGQIIKELAGIVGGGGGGKPNFAQAGGKDANRLPAALQRAREILAQC